MDDKIAILEGIPLFAGLEREALERIARLADREEVDAGTTLTHEGRYEGYFYIVGDGTVEFSRRVVVATSGSGSFIGEISMLDAGPRTTTATTTTPCVLLKLDTRGFEALLQADPSVAEALEAEMTRHLEQTDTGTAS